jgi:hypothetical protein
MDEIETNWSQLLLNNLYKVNFSGTRSDEFNQLLDILQAKKYNSTEYIVILDDIIKQFNIEYLKFKKMVIEEKYDNAKILDYYKNNNKPYQQISDLALLYAYTIYIISFNKLIIKN